MKHGLGPDHILGQEVSELLGAVILDRQIDRSEEYKVSNVKNDKTRGNKIL